MDLKSGQIAWTHSLEQVSSYPPLMDNVTCDVAIIGAGISGALAAYECSKAGLHVVVVDKRRIGHGSTCASTGLLQGSNDKTLSSCIHTFGRESGTRFYTLCKEAVQKLLRIKDELMMDPELDSRPSLYYATEEADVPALKEEYEQLILCGFDVEWLEASHIKARYGFSKPAAIYSRGDAEVNPFRFVHALFDTAVSRYGVRIYEETKIVHHNWLAHGVQLVSGKGAVVEASYVIFATGYETQEIKADTNAVIESTYALVTTPIPDLERIWPDRCLIWETARPYLYLRTTVDNRIVAGGLDVATVIPEERDRMLKHKTYLLEQEIEKLFPALAPIRSQYAWTAAFGSTHDGYPMIGPHPQYPHCFFIEGYGGNGIAYSTIAANIILTLIKQGEHPDAHLFSLTRSHHPAPPVS
ncbi:NAD(P)/FAD-dependent oxidoreductase [Paenibacillus taiwanensis]|uniref:NAD(P)/FAD-dependent oxidoreductase n=1 Tax=Paenibacillus taiwanensis TaxID=401638 RepID=UPI00040755A8|nr:FAD-dependent oxidoreductase [Paenibacillus taiwanensis]